MTYLSFVWYLATQRVSLKQYMEWIKKADKICILCCLICWVLCGFRETDAVSQTLPGIANMNAMISQGTAIYYWSWNTKNVQPASLYSWEINSLPLLISIVLFKRIKIFPSLHENRNVTVCYIYWWVWETGAQT